MSKPQDGIATALSGRLKCEPVRTVGGIRAVTGRWFTVALLAAGLLGCAALRPEPRAETLPTQAQGEAVFDLQPLTAHLATAVPEPARRAEILAVAAVLAERQQEWQGWVLPLLQRYLPHDTLTTDWRVQFGVGLDEPVSVHAPAQLVIVDLAAGQWSEGAEAAADAVWNGMVRALYRHGLALALPSAAEPTGAALILSALQRDGLIDFVAAKGRPFGLDRRDYRLAMQRDDVEVRFAVLDAYTRARAGLLAVPGPRTWSELAAYDQRERLFGVTGAYMAQAIEARHGRSVLVATIQKGPQGFYEAYVATRPGALVFFDASPQPAAPQRREPERSLPAASPLAE